jgi:L-2-hydroxyglutarate oxidase LhgO
MVTRYFAKGNYYKLEGVPTPFRMLIYPVPEKNTAGLGVHATLDLNHQIKFGPDVEWLAGVARAAEITPATYEVDPARARDFYAAIRKCVVDVFVCLALRPISSL